MLPWLSAVLAVVGIFFLWRGYVIIRQQILRRRVAYMLYLAALEPRERRQFEDLVEQ